MAAWITYAEVKAYCGIDVTDTSKDAIITANIPRVQALIENYCLKIGGLWGTFTDIIETLTAPDNCNKIFIEKHPAFTTLSYVKEGGKILGVDEYETEPTAGAIIRVNGDWSTEPNSIEVKYTYTNPVPEDIKLAALEYTGVISNIKNKSFTTDEGIERTVNQGIPDFVTAILNSYKVPRFIMHQ